MICLLARVPKVMFAEFAESHAYTYLAALLLAGSMASTNQSAAGECHKRAPEYCWV